MRLLTRGDLDGLACAVLITSCEDVSEIVLVHPQDVTSRRIEVTGADILANLPYLPGCAKWFDHHLLTGSDERPPERFEGRYGLAPSAARVVYEHYVGGHAHLQRYERLLAETDRLDSAFLNLEDVLEPRDYILLGYTLDPRTGLGAAYEDYFRQLVGWVKSLPIEAVMEQPPVRERVARIRDQDERFRELTRMRSHLDGNAVVTDFRGQDPVPVGNRFLVYTLFPQANVSVRIHRGPVAGEVAIAVAHSIFNRTCRTNVGSLLAGYGGGGHRGAATCLAPADQADAVIAQIVGALKKDG
jgi:hypothetical protein